MEQILQNDWIAKHVAPYLHLDHWEDHLSSLQTYSTGFAGNFTKSLQNTNWASFTNTNLEKNDLALYLSNAPIFPWLFFFHALLVCCNLRNKLKNEHWVFSLLVTCISSVTGGSLASYMVCRVPGWMHSNVMMPLVIVLWYFVNYIPGFYQIATSVPIKYFVILGAQAMKVRSIAAGVELAVEVSPQSTFLAILLGTISGFGGALTGNWLTKLLGDETHLSEFSKPTWSIKSAFFAAVAYYVALDPRGIFWGPLASVLYIRTAILFYLALHALTVEIVGPFTPFPISQIESIFSIVTRIGRKQRQTATPAYNPTFITKEELHEISKKEKGTIKNEPQVSKKNKKNL